MIIVYVICYQIEILTKCFELTEYDFLQIAWIKVSYAYENKYEIYTCTMTH